MKIIGTGSALPRKVVTNEMLSGFLDTSDEWITTRTGVRSRYVISDERLEDLAIEAARQALDDASIDSADLDFIICSNVVNEYVTPQLSCIVQAGRVNNVLIVCAEEPTRMTDWNDRRTCVLFGDGAGAAVLAPGNNIKSIRLSASNATDKLWQYRILHPTPYITKDEQDVPLQMKGQDVFKFAVKAASGDISRTLKDAGICADDVDHYLLHQANVRIISAIGDYLEQPQEKFPVNIADHGNSSSASCPILLDECSRKGRFKKGDMIAMSAFGAGFVSGAVLFEW